MSSFVPNPSADSFDELRRDVEKVEGVRTFAVDFLRTLSSTFCMHDCKEDTSQMRTEMSKLVGRLKRERPVEGSISVDGSIDVSEAVRKARKILGQNSDVYLQVGITMLWTGEPEAGRYDTDEVDIQNTLFPSSIRSYGSMQQLSVDAKALSLLRGRKEALEQRRNHLYEELQLTLLPLMAYLLSIKEVDEYVRHRFQLLKNRIELGAEPVEPAEADDAADSAADDVMRKRAINSEVTEAIRHTNDLLDVLTGSSMTFSMRLTVLGQQLGEAESQSSFYKFTAQMQTLIQLVAPLLESEETQANGPLNMALLDTCLCDAAANEQQFPPTALLRDETISLTSEYIAAVKLNSSISKQIESYAAGPPLFLPEGGVEGGGNLSMFSPYTPPTPAGNDDQSTLRFPFAPLELVNYNGLTSSQLLPVYTCATRQLFSLPSPTQSYKNENQEFVPYTWYTLPGGKLLGRSAMRPLVKQDVERIYEQATDGSTRVDGVLQHHWRLDSDDQKFKMDFRIKIIENQILRNGQIGYIDAAIEKTPGSSLGTFRSLPVVKTCWLPLAESSTADKPKQNQFSLDETSRAACRSTLLGALSTGAYAQYTKLNGSAFANPTADETKAKSTALRVASLFKLHQLAPLLFIRSNTKKTQTWKEDGANYNVSLNVKNNKEISTVNDVELFTPLPPLYVHDNITRFTAMNAVPIEDSKGVQVKPFIAKSAEAAEAAGAAKFIEMKRFNNTLDGEGETPLKIGRESIEVREELDSTPDLNDVENPNSLSSQTALLNQLIGALKQRPYATPDNVSNADDGRPMMRLLHRSLFANRRLMRECARNETSIKLMTNILLQTGEATGISGDPRGDTSGGFEADSLFYQGRAALQSQGQRGAIDAVERGRREAVWKDALRELTISGDKLFIFLKTLAGLLHDDVTNIIKMEDRSMEQAQRVRAEQRREALRATMSFSQRSMYALMGAIFRQSNFRLDVDQSQDGASQATTMAGELVVVSEETVDRIRKLANETNNRSFFETQSQLTSFLEQSKGVSMPLQELVQGVRAIIRTQLTESLDMANRIDVHDERGAMDFLSQPRNSLIVRLKNETFAAIRQAYDALTVEMNAKGRRLQMQGIPVYVCVEGPSRPLCDQFAALSAYFMSQSRLFSSSASVYVSAQSASSNALMLRVALQKCCMRAIEYHQGRY